MTRDQEPREVSEADIDAAVGALFGRSRSPVSRAAALEAFRVAGFGADVAERGADMMESGRFFGFEDVASTLSLSPSTWAGRQMVTPERIREAGKRLEAQQTALQEASTAKSADEPAVQEIDRAVAGLFGRQVNG